MKPTRMATWIVHGARGFSSATQCSIHLNEQGDEDMVMQLFTCPHCAAGFSTHDELHTHGREAHRDTTPKDDKLYGGASDAGFADHAEHDAHVAENHDKGIERIEKTKKS